MKVRLSYHLNNNFFLSFFFFKNCGILLIVLSYTLYACVESYHLFSQWTQKQQKNKENPTRKHCLQRTSNVENSSHLVIVMEHIIGLQRVAGWEGNLRKLVCHPFVLTEMKSSVDEHFSFFFLTWTRLHICLSSLLAETLKQHSGIQGRQ